MAGNRLKDYRPRHKKAPAGLQMFLVWNGYLVLGIALSINIIAW